MAKKTKAEKKSETAKPAERGARGGECYTHHPKNEHYTPEQKNEAYSRA